MVSRYGEFLCVFPAEPTLPTDNGNRIRGPRKDNGPDEREHRFAVLDPAAEMCKFSCWCEVRHAPQ